MKNEDSRDEPRREKENMDEPQEEFISDDPPSRSRPANPEKTSEREVPPPEDE